jgi:hypothetical protein
VAYLMNSVAFKTHSDDAELESMARALGTTAGRLLPTLRRLEKAGWLTVDEGSLTFVYPTVAAIQAMNPNIDKAEAEKTVRRSRRK